MRNSLVNIENKCFFVNLISNFNIRFLWRKKKIPERKTTLRSTFETFVVDVFTVSFDRVQRCTKSTKTTTDTDRTFRTLRNISRL